MARQTATLSQATARTRPTIDERSTSIDEGVTGCSSELSYPVARKSQWKTVRCRSASGRQRSRDCLIGAAPPPFNPCPRHPVMLKRSGSAVIRCCGARSLALVADDRSDLCIETFPSQPPWWR
jgi:hypothetical protein